MENIKEMVKFKFSIKESRKLKNFLEVYKEWCYNSKGLYTNMTMYKYVNKLVDGYEKFNGSYVKVHKKPGATSINLSESKLK